MHVNRREFIGAISVGVGGAAVSVGKLHAGDKPAAAFTLGLGTYTFRNQDIAGLIERCRDLNLRTIELSHPQFMLPQADLSTFSTVRRQLVAGGVDLRSWFCGDLTKASDIDRMREGAGLFGVRTVSGSATHELLDAVNAACDKGGFRFGIHNHYFANRKFLYESPDEVLKALYGRPALFSTFDTGHMIACGFDPTNAYEKLKSHIGIIHLKDEDAPGHCVVIGKGKGDMAHFLRTISQDHFGGLAAIEFEEGSDPREEVAQCAAFIRDQVSLGAL
ncbi:MAG: sugar phosphate isomerase/epimerase [Acidobacteriaceae bacterium]|nr:sugar phosphate isomerase/epimerase [Acidobacteriaceae bacterium]MBV9498325.1 sugar phosphate isomerase/epimerase [Acidobacteriaceae bacterium]